MHHRTNASFERWSEFLTPQQKALRALLEATKKGRGRNMGEAAKKMEIVDQDEAQEAAVNPDRKQTIAVAVPPAVKAKLAQLAAQDSRTLSNFVCMLLTKAALQQ